MNQPNVVWISPSQRFTAPISVIAVETNHTTSLGFDDTTIEPYLEADSFTFLCNAPNSKYLPPVCTNGVHCWNFEAQFKDIDLINDINQLKGYSSSPIAYWNQTLFIFGATQIHYTDNITLFNHDDHFNWKHISWNAAQKLKTWNIAQRYAQYGSYLYVYTMTNDDKDYLLELNLGSLEGKAHLSPYNSFMEEEEHFAGDGSYENVDSLWRHCMVADANYVYIIGYKSMRIYNIYNNSWNITNIDGILLVSCAIIHKYIYIFGNSLDYEGAAYSSVFVVKYDTFTTIFESLLNIANPCIVHDSFITSIVGADGKIYLHGCHMAPWKTVIFNPERDEFETETMDIISIETNHIPYYRSAQIVSMDDNILLLFYHTNTKYPRQNTSFKSYSYPLYFTVTHALSINFMKTIPQNLIWPSDFMIKYDINDFKNDINPDIYNIVFQSDEANITAYITLQTSNDHCICNESVYKCYYCYQQFDLKNYLLPKDNNINEIVFRAISYDSDVLILPTFIPISFTRCNISFDYIDASTTNENPFITFHFILSSNCYSRIGTIFSLNITSSTVQISKQLRIEIINASFSQCNICDIGTESCFLCDDTFVIAHETNGMKDRSFNIFIESNRNDFRVVSLSSHHMVHYFNVKLRIKKYFRYLLFLLFIPCIICILFIYWKHQYNKAFIVDKAMVLIIPISQFDDTSLFLPGINQNVVDLAELWRDNYNYDVYICNEATLYSTRDDVINFIDDVINKLDIRNENNGFYPCVIVHILSHGSNDSFMCSDGNKVKIDFICHELISIEEFNDHLSFIKLIFYHGCRGNIIYHDNTASKDTSAFRGVNVHATINNNDNENISPHSNVVIFSGNIEDRSMSDEGWFTKYICQSFRENVERTCKPKADFISLLTQIGSNLEKKTRHAEICNINNTLRFNPVRFEKCNDMRSSNEEYEAVSTVEMLPVDDEKTISNLFELSRK